MLSWTGPPMLCVSFTTTISEPTASPATAVCPYCSLRQERLVTPPTAVRSCGRRARPLGSPAPRPRGTPRPCRTSSSPPVGTDRRQRTKRAGETHIIIIVFGQERASAGAVHDMLVVGECGWRVGLHENCRACTWRGFRQRSAELTSNCGSRYAVACSLASFRTQASSCDAS